MNNFVFQQAQAAYENQDYASALNLFNATLADSSYPLEQGEHGLLFHQIGNCFVKLENYTEAVSAYGNAANDEAYSGIGTVYCNLGMAYVYMNDLANAIASFQTAVNIPSYETKYKAFTAMGNALMKNGKSAEAGAAFRRAALDGSNPDPTRALLNLGVCFMALGRAQDAVVAYESAFQFEATPDIKNRLYANLGQAYCATGQMQRVVSSFENALADKTYHLSESASVDYQRAIGAVSRGEDLLPMEGTGSLSLAGAGLAAGVAGAAMGADQASAAEKTFALNPVDQNFANQNSDFSGLDVVNEELYNSQTQPPVSNPDHTAVFNGVQGSGQMNPVNPGDDKQFASSDDDFAEWTKSTEEVAYYPQKRRSGGKIALVIVLILILLALVAGAFLYTQGFGIPTQEMVTKQLLENPSDAQDKVFAPSVSDSKKTAYSNMVYQDPNPNINGVDRDMKESVVYVTGKSSSGGTIEYKIKMTRDLLGWKIQSVDLAFASVEQ